MSVIDYSEKLQEYVTQLQEYALRIEQHEAIIKKLKAVISGDPPRWFVHEDEEGLRLQVELGNDYAILLTIWKTGDPPDVTLWHGAAESSVPGDADAFREWLAKIPGADAHWMGNGIVN
jgi:hypothetical protein